MRSEDLPDIAEIYGQTFRPGQALDRASLVAYLQDSLFNDPWRDPDLTCRVFVGKDGRPQGFIGALPARMSLGGRPLRAAIAASMMVRDHSAEPFAGAMLLKSLLAGPQDLTFSNTANNTSRRLWSAAGGHVLESRSARWFRLLRPAAGAMALAASYLSWARPLIPLARLVDLPLGRVPSSLYSLPEGEHRSVALSADELLGHLRKMQSRYALRPAWDPDGFRWRLARAAEHETRGELLHRLVVDRRQRPVGCYSYRKGPRDTASVMHLVSAQDQARPVLAALLRDAARERMAAVSGPVTAELLSPALKLRALILPAAHTLLHTRDPEVLDAARKEDLFVDGLAGENWIRLADDTFAGSGPRA